MKNRITVLIVVAKLVNIIDIVAISNTSKRVYRNRIEEKIGVVE